MVKHGQYDSSPGEGTADSEDFDADLRVAPPTDTPDQTLPASTDHELKGDFTDLTNDELGRLSVIQAGTRLEQGATYIDLNDLVGGPFTALGGHEVGPDDRLVAKRQTDYELWGKVVGQGSEVKVERPETGEG